MNNKKLISIISPAFNEEKNIPKLVQEIQKIMSSFKKLEYECILIDDGSTDNTWLEIVRLAKKNKRIKGIRFSRNFGQQIALTAGIDFANGQALIYCDSDLQHPPTLFSRLISEWEKGFKIVHTKRLETRDISAFKKLMSKIFYRISNILSDTKIEEGMADFKLLDKEVYLQLRQMREKNRFLRGMVSWMGYPSTIIKYKARKRISGKPWYNFSRNLEFAKIGILSLSTKPLKYILYLGFFLILFSLISLLVVFSIMFYEKDIRYFSPTIVLVTFNTLLIGFVIVCLGIVAIYLSYLYKEIIQRPTYLVSDKTNIPKINN